MSPTVVGALGCALSFIVGWWLRRASAVAELKIKQAAVERALKGEQEWAQLAVERRAVIDVLEARAVTDEGRGLAMTPPLKNEVVTPGSCKTESYQVSVHEHTTFSAQLLDNNSNEPSLACGTYETISRQEALDDLAYTIAQQIARHGPLDLHRVPEPMRSQVLVKLKALQQDNAEERARIEEALAPSNLKESS